MRIIDWSSDVCSSDLLSHPPSSQDPLLAPRLSRSPLLAISAIAGVMNHEDCASGICPPPSSRAEAIHEQEVVENRRVEGALEQTVRFVVARPNDFGAASVKAWRSEEHTSELQSLMRISYAVFRLKKKTINT